MTLRIENTNSSAVNAAISSERHRLGASATGMVLTLVIVTDEQHQSEAARAATYSANQHPCRILVVIPRPGRGKPILDAEINVGDRDGPGETIKLRLKGPLANHQASVVLPLLLPDTPVVAWWPGAAPSHISSDQIGSLAWRRITDAASASRPMAALSSRAATYEAGDTDLTWTRTTPWRSMLATALDEPFAKITSAQVSAQRGNASAALLATWLHSRLHVPVTLKFNRGPGITDVCLETSAGPITLSRPDGSMATLSKPGTPTQRIPLPRRELRDLLSEELRRLDADEIYESALEHVSEVLAPAKGKKSTPTPKESS